MHSPSVQFLDCRSEPSQSLPPFLGAGALHSLLLQWVHSIPQADHLLHSVHRPSTGAQAGARQGGRVKGGEGFGVGDEVADDEMVRVIEGGRVGERNTRDKQSEKCIMYASRFKGPVCKI